ILERVLDGEGVLGHWDQGNCVALEGCQRIPRAWKLLDEAKDKFAGRVQAAGSEILGVHASGYVDEEHEVEVGSVLLEGFVAPVDFRNRENHGSVEYDEE